MREKTELKKASNCQKLEGAKGILLGQGDMVLMRPWLWTCSLRISEAMNSSLGHPLVIIHSRSPTKPLQTLSLQRPIKSSQMLTTNLIFFFPKLQPVWVSSICPQLLSTFSNMFFPQEVDAFSANLVYVKFSAFFELFCLTYYFSWRYAKIHKCVFLKVS